MLRKWYIELPFILLFILLSVLLVWNSSFEFPSISLLTKSNDRSPDAGTKDAAPSANTDDWTEGKSLYKANCAACHNPKVDGTGPALAGSVARWEAAGNYKGKSGEQWLRIWVKNWNEVVSAGHKYGIDMANSRPAQMNVFSNLSDKQIDEIFLYIENTGGSNKPVSKTVIP